MIEHLRAVIMAGGGGTRLWPLSRRSKPKQSQRLLGDRSLFQLTVDRLLPLIPPNRIHVVTVDEQTRLLHSQAPSIPEANFILEPEPKGTAPVVGLAAVTLLNQDPDCVMACLPADHYIENTATFRSLLRAAFDLGLEGDLVTLGVQPILPATGFGYIRCGELRGVFQGHPSYRVRSFKEKPSTSVARRYLREGGYLWNSGMFIWKAERILEVIRELMPELGSALAAMHTGRNASRDAARLWSGLQYQTIDYGLMERADRVSVFPAEGLGWWDIGSWAGLFSVMKADSQGNLDLSERSLLLDTRNTLVFQEPHADRARLIATLGVRDLAIVDTGDVILVCARSRAEQVRDLVEALARSGKSEYL